MFILLWKQTNGSIDWRKEKKSEKGKELARDQSKTDEKEKKNALEKNNESIIELKEPKPKPKPNHSQILCVCVCVCVVIGFESWSY